MELGLRGIYSLQIPRCLMDWRPGDLFQVRTDNVERCAIGMHAGKIARSSRRRLSSDADIATTRLPTVSRNPYDDGQGVVRPRRIANRTRPGTSSIPSFCITRLRYVSTLDGAR
jgi:hypothetical protein